MLGSASVGVNVGVGVAPIGVNVGVGEYSYRSSCRYWGAPVGVWVLLFFDWIKPV